MKILSEEDFVEHYPEFTNGIFIRDPGQDIPNQAKTLESYLMLFFHDIGGCGGQYVKPNIKHLIQAISYYKTCDDKTFFVCCRHGRSRSSAIAFVLNKVQYSDNRNILDYNKHTPNFEVMNLARDVGIING